MKYEQRCSGCNWLESEGHAKDCVYGVDLNRAACLEQQAAMERDHMYISPLDKKYWRDDVQYQLARFYAVHTKDALIEAQAKHIEKLQAKLPPLRDTQPGRVREG